MKKYQIEEYKLESTKDLILSVRQAIKLLSTKESNYINKQVLESCLSSLKLAHENLEKHATNEPLRKMFIGSK